jgi:hypothetical protein
MEITPEPVAPLLGSDPVEGPPRDLSDNAMMDAEQAMRDPQATRDSAPCYDAALRELSELSELASLREYLSEEVRGEFGGEGGHTVAKPDPEGDWGRTRRRWPIPPPQSGGGGGGGGGWTDGRDDDDEPRPRRRDQYR